MEENPYIEWRVGIYLDKRKEFDAHFLTLSEDLQDRLFNAGLVPASWFGL